MQIDYIITYLDNHNFDWILNYIDDCQENNRKIQLNSSRFRNLGLLRYHLRSVANFMPWIRNLYLVVANKAQVPNWINRKNVHIVTHEDIIPSKYLYTYNSNTIEMFFHNIPSLSEYFIYANDDVLPNMPLTINDFFDEYYNCNPRMQITEINNKHHQLFINNLLNAKKLVYKDLNIKEDNKILKSDHSFFSMRKSTYEYFWNKYENIFDKSLTKFRENKNIQINVFNLYHYFTNTYSLMNRNNRYFDLNTDNLEIIKEAINDKNIDAICLNDNGNIREEFDQIIKEIIDVYNKKLPKLSKYELK